MYKFILIPLISAFIGYLTNVVAIRMLFWPRQPVNLLFFQLHGLLPKRRAELASSLGNLVEEQLLSLDDLFEKLIPRKYGNYKQAAYYGGKGQAGGDNAAYCTSQSNTSNS